jgi:hypothetical protein
MNERLVFVGAVILAAGMYLVGLLSGGIHITVETTTVYRPESGYSSYYTPDADTYTPSYDYEYTPAPEKK